MAHRCLLIHTDTSRQSQQHREDTDGSRMAYSSIGTRLQAHGYLLAHGMVSDRLLTIGTPSDNNTSIRTPTAHRWLIVPSVPGTHLTAHNSIEKTPTAHGRLIVPSIPGTHLTAHTSIRTPTAHGWLIVPSMPGTHLTAHTSIEKTRTPHGYLLAHGMVSAIICNNGWLIDAC